MTSIFNVLPIIIRQIDNGMSQIRIIIFIYKMVNVYLYSIDSAFPFFSLPK